MPEVCFTFIGLAVRHGKEICLCAPGGREVFRVPRKAVRQITGEQLAARLMAERRAHLAARN